MRKQNFIVESILRPQNHIEKNMEKDIRKCIFNKYESKIYTNPDEINEILKCKTTFYELILEDNIRKFNKNELIYIILSEYEKAAEITRASKFDFRLAEEINNLGWRRLGPLFKRAMKFIAEKALMIDSKGISLNKHKKEEALSKIIIAAEELASAYMSSESIYRIFPNESSLCLNKNNEIYFELKLEKNRFMEEFDAKMKIFIRGKNFNPKEEVAIINSETEDVFKKDMGVSYNEIIDIFNNQIGSKNQGVQKVSKKTLIESISQKWNISYIQVVKLLDGFTVRKENLINEKREFYKPKQKYRALYRGFFEIEEKDEKYIIWSKGMAMESVLLMNDKLKFQYIPEEWKSKELNKAIRRVSNIFGKKFEIFVKDELRNRGIEGRNSFLKVIGELKIPKEVGEIDYLGIDIKNKQVILGECKYISSGSEPKYWSDDIDKFRKENGYIGKFKKKIEFIESNFETVKINLKKEFKVNESLKDFKLRTVLITYYPTIMELLCDEFEVVNLSYFLHKY